MKRQHRAAGLKALMAGLVVSVTWQAHAGVTPSDYPPRNPYLADSPYAVSHSDSGQSDFSPVAGPIDRSRRLNQDEIIYKPIGFANAWEYLYSGPYPDGRRAIWSGGRDRVVKLDADTLEVLATHAFKGRFYSESEVSQFFAKLDRRVEAAQGKPERYQEVFDFAYSQMVPAAREGAGALYKMVSSDNELFFLVKDPSDGRIYIESYGDAKPGDIASPIMSRGRLELPTPKGLPTIPMAINMTYDGWVVAVTNDGSVFVVSRDLKKFHTLLLPEARTEKQSGEWMGGLVRNSVSVGDDGAIYVVSRVMVHRLQWTGTALSLDPRDGAWSLPYESGVNGSGTTPTLLGFGADRDRLVVMMDGVKNINLYWRDHIPDDWRGIEGQPRRLAGTLTLDFGAGTPDKFRIEAAPAVLGYGFFWENDTSKTPPAWQGAFDKQVFANYLGAMFPEHAVFGGVKYEWRPKTRTVEQVWVSDLSLTPTICAPNVNGLLYCTGRREGEYSVEALDWETGKPVFHYLLGNSTVFNQTGFITRIAPNGSIDLCSMGAAIVRLTPKAAPSVAK